MAHLEEKKKKFGLAPPLPSASLELPRLHATKGQ